MSIKKMSIKKLFFMTMVIIANVSMVDIHAAAEGTRSRGGFMGAGAAARAAAQRRGPQMTEQEEIDAAMAASLAGEGSQPASATATRPVVPARPAQPQQRGGFMGAGAAARAAAQRREEADEELKRALALSKEESRAMQQPARPAVTPAAKPGSRRGGFMGAGAAARAAAQRQQQGQQEQARQRGRVVPQPIIAQPVSIIQPVRGETPEAKYARLLGQASDLGHDVGGIIGAKESQAAPIQQLIQVLEELIQQDPASEPEVVEQERKWQVDMEETKRQEEYFLFLLQQARAVGLSDIYVDGITTRKQFAKEPVAQLNKELERLIEERKQQIKEAELKAVEEEARRQRTRPSGVPAVEPVPAADVVGAPLETLDDLARRAGGRGVDERLIRAIMVSKKLDDREKGDRLTIAIERLREGVLGWRDILPKDAPANLKSALAAEERRVAAVEQEYRREHQIAWANGLQDEMSDIAGRLDAGEINVEQALVEVKAARAKQQRESRAAAQQSQEEQERQQRRVEEQRRAEERREASERASEGLVGGLGFEVARAKEFGISDDEIVDILTIEGASEQDQIQLLNELMDARGQKKRGRRGEQRVVTAADPSSNPPEPVVTPAVAQPRPMQPVPAQSAVRMQEPQPVVTPAQPRPVRPVPAARAAAVVAVEPIDKIKELGLCITLVDFVIDAEKLSKEVDPNAGWVDFTIKSGKILVPVSSASVMRRIVGGGLLESSEILKIAYEYSPNDRMGIEGKRLVFVQRLKDKLEEALGVEEKKLAAE